MSDTKKALSCDQECVRDWCWRHGENPSDDQVRNAIHAYVFDWMQHRRNGMDVLASSVLDDLEEIISALKDRI